MFALLSVGLDPRAWVRAIVFGLGLWAISLGSAEAQSCSPISSLSCPSIPVSTAAPYRLDFSGGAGGLSGTGFTAVLAPSVNRYPVTPSIATIPGYEPSLIDVSGGVLTLTTTRGSLIQTQPSNTANNTQVNALAVAFAATSPRIVRVRLLSPVFPDTANGEHAGLWFGLGEDDYVRLAVINRTGAGLGTIELRREVGGVSTAAATDVQSAPLSNLGGATVTLELLLDPVNGRVSGRYSSTTGETGRLGPLSVPASFFSGGLLPDGATGPVSLAGVLASSRFNATTPALPYTFDDFAIDLPGSEPAAVADSIAILAGETATTLAGGQTSVLANDADADGDPLTALLVAGPAHGSLTLSADGTFVYVHSGDSSTTDAFTYRANDGLLNSTDQTVSITITPICGGIGLGACSTLPVSIASPRVLTFAGGGGGLANTGFNIVQRPSLNRYPATPSVPALPGYEPDLISVSGGVLTLTPTRGSFLQTPALNAANNTQVNALGLPFQVGSETVRIGGEVIRPVLPDTANGEAGGLWFGLDEDNYVRLAVVNRTGADLGQIELRREIAGATSAAATDLDVANVTALSTSTVTLQLRIDPVARTAMASYVSTSGESGTLGPLNLPASLVSGVMLADGVTGPVSFAGVFATSRFNATTTPPFTFDNVSLSAAANTAPVATGEILSVPAVGGAGTILVGGATSVLANDTDAEGDSLTAVLVTGPAHGALTLNANGTFTYTHDGGVDASDSFVYRASDGLSSSNTATVTIVIGDTRGPSVLSISGPLDGRYLAGDPLTFSVRFDEAVVVDLSGGSPRLPLTLNSGTVYAVYVSGSGSDTLIFRFTPGPADEDQDGVDLGGSIDPNGAVLRDLVGNPATLALNNAPSFTGVRIGAAAPPAPLAIPTRGEWAFAILACLVAAAGVLALRRRQPLANG